MLRFLIKRNLSTLSTVWFFYGFLFFHFWNPGGTYIRLFRETMPISQIVLSFYAETALVSDISFKVFTYG